MNTLSILAALALGAAPTPVHDPVQTVTRTGPVTAEAPAPTLPGTPLKPDGKPKQKDWAAAAAKPTEPLSAPSKLWSASAGWRA